MTDATPQPAAPQPAAPQPVPAGPLTPAEDKQWATFAHFGGILGLLPSLIIFLVFKDRGALTRQESKEALNWQITWIAAFIVLQIVVAIITGIAVAVALGSGSYGAYTGLSVVTGLLGFVAWIPYLANIVFSIIGGVKVNGGGAYRYPVAIRLVK
ncbi:MAG: DUF4870 domain-containing protein [Actinobacteria bacterium]|jgi:hypothetical protein|nr:DUF4870 domain-containing protein [Actinomycetota bacterium]